MISLLPSTFSPSRPSTYQSPSHDSSYSTSSSSDDASSFSDAVTNPIPAGALNIVFPTSPSDPTPQPSGPGKLASNPSLPTPSLSIDASPAPAKRRMSKTPSILLQRRASDRNLPLELEYSPTSTPSVLPSFAGLSFSTSQVDTDLHLAEHAPALKTSPQARLSPTPVHQNPDSFPVAQTAMASSYFPTSPRTFHQSAYQLNNVPAPTPPSSSGEDEVEPKAGEQEEEKRRSSAASAYAQAVRDGQGGRRMSVQGAGVKLKHPQAAPVELGKPVLSSKSRRSDYDTYDSCIMGAIGHEKKARAYGENSSPKAMHHFTRANNLLDLALGHRKNDLEATIYKSNLLTTLLPTSFTPSIYLRPLQSLLATLRHHLSLPLSHTPPQLLLPCKRQKANLLFYLARLTRGSQLAFVPRAIYSGPVGEMGREAVSVLEAVVGAEETAEIEGTEELRLPSPEIEKRKETICWRPRSRKTMIENLLALADTAAYVADLAIEGEPAAAEKFIAIHDGAVEKASALAREEERIQWMESPAYKAAESLRSVTPTPTVASTPTSEHGPWSPPSLAFDDRSPSHATGATPSLLSISNSTIAEPAPLTALSYDVRLRVGPSRMRRILLSFTLNPNTQINLHHTRSILGDMDELSTTLISLYRPLPSSATKNNVQESESSKENKRLAVKAASQLGDAQFLLAHLLKRTWKARRDSNASAAESAHESRQAYGRRRSSVVSTSSTDSGGSGAGSSSGADRSGLLSPRRQDASRHSRRKGSYSSLSRHAREDSHTIVEEEDEPEESLRPKAHSTIHRAGSNQSLPGAYTYGGPVIPASPIRRGSLANIRRTSSIAGSSISSFSSGSYENQPLFPPAYTSTSPLSAVVPLAGDRRQSHAPSAPGSPMSHARRISQADSLVPDQDSSFPSHIGSASEATAWSQRKPSVIGIKLPSPQTVVDPTAGAFDDELLPSIGVDQASPLTSPEEEDFPVLSASQLAEKAWNLLSSSVKNFKISLSLLKPTSTTTSNLLTPAASTRSSPSSENGPTSSSSTPPIALNTLQRAQLLLSISSASYFRASLAPRVAAAKTGRTSLLVTAEVYASWAAKELSLDYLIDDLPNGTNGGWQAGLGSSASGLVGVQTELGLRAVFVLMRTIWHKAVTGKEGEVHKEEKRMAKERVEHIVRRLKSELSVGQNDVTRFKIHIERFEGDFERPEQLFWGGITKTLMSPLA